MSICGKRLRALNNRSDMESTRMCNVMLHTSLDLDASVLEDMNQKLNYYKALQIAASLTTGVIYDE